MPKPNDIIAQSVEPHFDKPHDKLMAREIVRALEADGMVIVPVQLTPAMILAACDHIQKDGTGFTEAWAAAIAARNS